jgi:hypothetical protein
MRTAALAAIALAVAAWSGEAAAQDKAACLDAASSAQKLRSAHSLVEARAQLRVCSSASCPAAVQTDCVGWLADVERSLPTVVVGAKNRAGTDLFDVKVSVDGAPLASKLDGQAVPMNPGAHEFHFEAADGSVLDQQVMVREGDKDQEVAVVLGAAAPAPGPTAPATTATTAQPPPAPGPSAADSDVGGGPPWKTIGWIAGAVGIAGLAFGATAGAIAMSKKSGECSGDVCQPNTAAGIKTAALVSDVGWIAGGVLLASGAALILFAPGGRQANAAIRIAPSFLVAGGGAMLEGRW